MVSSAGKLILPVTDSSGTITWHGDAAFNLPAYIGLTLIANGQTVSQESILIDAGHYKVDKVRGGRFDSKDGKVHVDVPVSAIDETLNFDVRDPSPNEMPGVSLTSNPVEIVAVGETSGANVNHFKQPITVQFKYQREEFDPWAEEDLMIFYYDPETLDWYPIPTDVDTKNKTISAKTDHLTVFDYKAATWQAESLPTVDAFKTSDFTGAGTYALNLWTPPGRAGFKPDLTLSYNSQVIDESSAYNQASWVGMGWSLDTGSVVRNMHETDAMTDDTFTLSLNGTSSQLLPISTSGTVTTYNTADQSYLKVKFDSTPKVWTVYAQDGSVYTFDKPVKTDATNGCVSTAPSLTWQWSLGSAKDKNNNTYTYTYSIEKKTGCQNEIAIYPAAIVYPHGLYQVRFVIDTAAPYRTDYQTSWTTAANRVLYGTKKLNEVVIESKDSGSWVPAKRYSFNYSSGTTNQIYPNFIWSKGGRTLTLSSIQEKSGDNSQLLPGVQFTYGDNMHLTQVDNGQGGKVVMNYVRWTYFDDINKSARSLYTIFGTDECVSGSIGTAWVRSTGPGPVRCDPTNYLQIGDPYLNGGSSAVGSRPIPEHLVKPGGRYRFLVNVKGIDGNATSVKWGFNDTGVANSKVMVSRSGVTALTAYDESLEMPATYNPSNTRLRMEVDWGFFQRIEFVLFPQFYQVTSRTVTGLDTDDDATYTYRYDNPSPNTKKVSDAVAAAGTNYTQLYTYPQREYRGSAMTQVVNPGNLATLNWYYQSDSLKGRAYRTIAMQQDFYDAMESIDLTQWSKSSVGTHSIWSLYGDHYDIAVQSSTTLNNWSVYYQRASASLTNGDTAIAHIRLSGTGSQGEVGLVDSGGQYFGVIIQPEGGQPVARVRYIIGGVTHDDTILIGAGDFKLDAWYGIMLMTDKASGNFRVKLWELGHPEISGEAVIGGFTANAWTFRSRVNSNGTTTANLLVDAYSEGTVYTENETYYSSATQYDTIAANGIPDLASSSLLTYKDLAVVWAYPTESIARSYDGNSSWSGTRTTFAYNLADQNGVQYGNQTEAIYFESSGENWVSHHAVKNEFWPLNSGTSYLVNSPGRTTEWDCTDVSDCTAPVTLIGETLRLYDANTVYNATPSAGLLSKQRTLLDKVNDVGRYGETGYQYDVYGNVTTVTTYTGYGSATASPSSGSQITQTDYDENYDTYAVTETKPLNQITQTAYKYSLGLPESVTDPNDVTVNAWYDLLGRMTSIRAPGDENESATLAIAYSNYASGNPYHITLDQKLEGNRTMKTVRYYSGLGKLVQSQTVDALLNTGTATIVVDTQYDKMGHVVKVTKPYPDDVTVGFHSQAFSDTMTTTTTYDPLGRVTQVEDPNNNSSTTTYNGLSVTQTDPKGNSTTTISNVWGQVINVTAETGTGLAYEYDLQGRLTTVTKGSGIPATTTTISYDLGGRKTAMDDPDMGTWSYTYDALGNLLTQEDARECLTTLSYDALNRLVNKIYSGMTECSATTAVNYYYDGTSFAFLGETEVGGGGTNVAGRRTGMKDGSGATLWTYDARGRKLSETKRIYSNEGKSAAENFTTSWTYNSADLPVSMTYPDNEVVNLVYNAQGAQNQLKQPDANGFIYVQDISYDEAGRIVGLGLGGSSSQALLTRTSTYNPWDTNIMGGKLASLVTSGSLQDLAYIYDANGNITQIDNADEITAYSYDQLNRLTGVTINAAASEAFGYEETTGRMSGKGVDANNLVDFTYDANHPHAVSSFNGSSYSYDANGNQTQRVLASGTYNLVYDGENHLISVTPAGEGLLAPETPLASDTPTATAETAAPSATATETSTPEVTQEAATLEPTTSVEPTQTTTPTLAELSLDEAAAVVEEPTPTLSNPETPTEVAAPETPILETPVEPTVTPVETMQEAETLTPTATLEPSATPDATATPTATLEPTATAMPEPGLLEDASTSESLSLTQISARYWYDGDGTLVKGDVDGMITYYAGRHYHKEVNGTAETVRKFYTAGSMQVAVRTISGGQDTLTWILTDHLGSTQVTANANGSKASELKYTAFGEKRPDSGDTTATKYQYTGQLSQMEEIGLYYYVARWYDPLTAHFNQADTIVPEPGNPGAWDRYGYVNYNPIFGTDPSGHFTCSSDEPESCNYVKRTITITAAQYGITFRGNWTWNEKSNATAAVYIIGNRISEASGIVNAPTAFNRAIGNLSFTMKSSADICNGCKGQTSYPNIDFVPGVYQRNVAHELGHAFDSAIYTRNGRKYAGTVSPITFLLSDGVYKGDRRNAESLVTGTRLGQYTRWNGLTAPENGFQGDRSPDQEHAIGFSDYAESTAVNENFADIFLNWALGGFAGNDAGDALFNWAETNMAGWVNSGN